MTVENPASSEVASLWLKSKSQSELWALVQHGNPQDIIPFSIALISQLNQVCEHRISFEVKLLLEVETCEFYLSTDGGQPPHDGADGPEGDAAERDPCPCLSPRVVLPGCGSD